MPTSDIPLAQLARIARPCSLQWSQLRGDSRRRHCDHCNKDVHNLSAMTEPAARRLLSSPEKLCCRYEVARDGKPITADKPIRLAWAKAAALIATALPFLTGCTRPAATGGRGTMGVMPMGSPAPQSAPNTGPESATPLPTPLQPVGSVLMGSLGPSEPQPAD
jgi:hypothetical protein